ncbi:MAG: PAS domain S-box protein [Acidobacteria bacterium]|nr:PAS domain S-box protein [Acidobacteriota bacterium]
MSKKPKKPSDFDSISPLAFMVESSDDAIIGKSLDGTIQTWNSGAERIYGYTAREAIGQSISFLTSRDRPNEIPRILDQIRCGERVAHYETVRVRKDGQPIDVSLTISPIKNATGEIIGASTIARDISVQKQAEQKLKTRAQQQAVVAELGQKALSNTPATELMETAVNLVTQISGFGFCGVVEYNLNEDTTFFKFGGGWEDKQFRDMRWPVGNTNFWNKVVQEKQPISFERIPGDASPTAPGQPQALGEFKSLCTLIPGSSHPFQILVVFSPSQTRFGPEDSYFLQAVANILATAFERKRAEENRSRLLERMMSSQEQERRWIARELHDETGQSLTSLLVGLRMIMDASSLKAAREQADRLRKITIQTLDNIGRLARGLHPSILDDLGLVIAVNRYAAEYQTSYGIETETLSEGMDQPELPASIKITLYRIFQEALTNVAKHAQATKVTISVKRQPNTITLQVKDDGIGFDLESALRSSSHSLHLGLLSMRERANLLGGHLQIVTAPSCGTTLTAVIPLTEAILARQ